MSSQIFKTQIPIGMLFELLDKICQKNEKHYILNSISFKKGVYTGDIPAFLEACKPYYHHSKRKYLEKKQTYKTFATVLRQICNHHQINYTSQIKYDKSTYDILYYIYFA